MTPHLVAAYRATGKRVRLLVGGVLVAAIAVIVLWPSEPTIPLPRPDGSPPLGTVVCSTEAAPKP